MKDKGSLGPFKASRSRWNDPFSQISKDGVAKYITLDLRWPEQVIQPRLPARFHHNAHRVINTGFIQEVR